MSKEIIVNSEKVTLEGKLLPVISHNEYAYLVNSGIGAHEVFVLPDGRISDGNTFDGIEIQIPTEREAIVEKYFSTSNSNGGARGADIHKSIKAPMPGLVKTICVHIGDAVTKGTQILILEAMKMENSIQAPINGKIATIRVEVGKNVEKNQALVDFQ